MDGGKWAGETYNFLQCYLASDDDVGLNEGASSLIWWYLKLVVYWAALQALCSIEIQIDNLAFSNDVISSPILFRA